MLEQRELRDIVTYYEAAREINSQIFHELLLRCFQFIV